LSGRAASMKRNTSHRTGLLLWWSITAASVLALYASTPYVREMQVLLRTSLQDHFDVIFRGTMAALGVALLTSGVWLELRRGRSAKPHGAWKSASLGKIVLRKTVLSVICVALYYFGLFHAICTNPAQGVRIIEFLHLFEYSLITILVLRAVSVSTKGYAGYVLAFIAMYLVGLGDEAVQGYIARRVGEFRDIHINAIVAGLAIVAVRLVFSPRALSGRSGPKHLRPILILIAASVIATAAFILSFHIGYRIDDDRCGVFYSLYPKEELLSRTDRATPGPLPPRGGSVASAAIKGYWAAEDFYETEARKHRAERDKLVRQERYWEAFCEEQIRRIYYKRYTDLGEWKGWTAERMGEEFGDYDIAGFVSYHHDLVFRDFRSWHVLAAAFGACIILLVVGIVPRGTRGRNADS